jgi:hypothetical protein
MHANAAPVPAANDWNRCRFTAGTQAGHYESYFQRANHPERPLAFWIRYTIFSPKGRAQDAVGELWAIFFDGEHDRITAVKEAIPIAQCIIGRTDQPSPDIQIGSARLTDTSSTGQALARGHRVHWDMHFEGDEPVLLLLPASLYEGKFPRAKALVSKPHARCHGMLEVDGETIAIDGWQGSLNHNWGSRHTDNYAWGQVASFDNAPDAFLECSTARLRIGPFWTPPLSILTLRIEGKEYQLNSPLQALRAKGRFEFFDWRMESHTKDVRITLRMHAPKSAFVGLKYDNPPGGSKTCLNTKLAACTLTLERAGQATRTLTTAHRAALEFLTDREDHGVPIVA